MSRLLECDDAPDDWGLLEGRWLARQKMALHSKRGRADLLRLKAALERLPRKELIDGRLCDGEGVCALGALTYRSLVDGGMSPKQAWDKLRRVPTMDDGEPIDGFAAEESVGFAVNTLGITETLAYAVMNQNDDFEHLGPEARYRRVMRWIDERLAEGPLASRKALP